MSLGLTLYLAAARRAGARVHKSDTTKYPARPAGKLVWLHISNAEEIAPVQELIRHLTADRPEVSFLVTTPDNIPVDMSFQDYGLHLPIPPDTPQQAAEFLDHWHPDIAVWAGSGLRPALTVATHSRDIPLLMVDARNRASVDGKKRWSKGVITAILTRFSHILVGKGAVARQIVQQGADPQTVAVCGFLEEGATTLFCDDRDRDDMAEIFAARPVWLAAHTIDAEDALVTSAHRSASRLSHRLLLIIAPKDPARGGALAQTLTDDGWIVAQRSLDQDPHEHVQIFIADTDDEMGLWLRLAPVCFMGNSLTKGSTGCSPFEASALGSAILHGPHVDRYKTGYARLGAAGAACKVTDTAQLASGVQNLLAPDKAAAMAHAGWEISTSGAQAADRAIALITGALDRTEDV